MPITKELVNPISLTKAILICKPCFSKSFHLFVVVGFICSNSLIMTAQWIILLLWDYFLPVRKCHLPPTKKKDQKLINDDNEEVNL